MDDTMALSADDAFMAHPETLEKKFNLIRIGDNMIIAYFDGPGFKDVICEIESTLLSRGWTEGDSNALVDNLEEWRLTQPLNEEEEEDIPFGMTERVYEKYWH
jgi:hypothetical protein